MLGIFVCLLTAVAGNVFAWDFTLDIFGPADKTVSLNQKPNITCTVTLKYDDYRVPSGYRLTYQTYDIKLHLYSIGGDDPMVCDINDVHEDSSWYAWSKYYGRYLVNRRIESHTKVSCEFVMDEVREETYRCATEYRKDDILHRYYVGERFNITTIRFPDMFVFVTSKSSSYYTDSIDLYEGEQATLTCVLLNVKPRSHIQWTSDIGSQRTSVVSKNSRNVFNQSVTANLVLTQLNLGKSASCRAWFDWRGRREFVAKVQLNVIYGPFNESLFVRSRRQFRSVTCPLKSNPAISSYKWTINQVALNCTSRSCRNPFHQNGTDRATCQGVNPKSGLFGVANIYFDRST